MVHVCGAIVGRYRMKREGMGEVHVFPIGHSAKERMVLPRMHGVPAHVRHLGLMGRGLELADIAADPAQTRRLAELQAPIRQQLHADADPQESHAPSAHGLGHGIDQAVAGGQGRHAGAEGPDAGQDDAVGPRHECRIRRRPDVERRVEGPRGCPQGLFGGGQVSGPVVDQGNRPHGVQRTPFVEAA